MPSESSKRRGQRIYYAECAAHCVLRTVLRIVLRTAALRTILRITSCNAGCVSFVRPLISDDPEEWIAKPPQQGEPRVPPTFEQELVAGDGSILGKGAYGVTRLSKSSFTGEYYAVRISYDYDRVITRALRIPPPLQREDANCTVSYPFVCPCYG